MVEAVEEITESVEVKEAQQLLASIDEERKEKE